MKSTFCLFASLLLLQSPAKTCSAERPPADSLPNFTYWLEQIDHAFSDYHQQSNPKLAGYRQQLQQLNTALQRPEAQAPEIGYPLLWKKVQLETRLQRLEAENDLKILRLRYQKSIELLRILYEKILSMDHHFTSLYTSQQILRISNPNEYAEFKNLRPIIDERLRKKAGFSLPSLMENNPYLSAVYSIVGLALGAADTRQDKAQLEKISCILDFTVRMHQDLHIIYYETEYLRDANLSLKQECEQLFGECTRQVGYTVSLTVCRENDDWEQLFSRLDQYIAQALQSTDPNAIAQKKARTNLQFATDRIVHFLDKYCAFVAQGNDYYKKFEKIASSYAHEKACTDVLPESFNRLKLDIEITLDKFNNAYNLPEIQGSRLKDLLYGILD